MTIFDPGNPEYWQEGSLLQEERRIFDICHGCRLCFNLCPSFPALFEITDRVEGDLSKATADDFRGPEDLCYQCKLCYVRCPYIPPHEYNLDFPRVMMRSKLVHSKKEGVTWQDRILGDTDLMGKLGGVAAPLANMANKIPPNRIALELLLGIHRRANLPQFNMRNFRAWSKKHLKKAPPQREVNGKAALFYTCFVNYNDPEVGKACIDVLEKNDVEIVVPQQRCCGMPFLDGGDAKRALNKIEYNLPRLAAMVGQGYEIVVPGPTCAYMLKQEYPTLMSDSQEAREVAQHTFEAGEYLMRLHRSGKLNTDFKNKAGKIAFHTPCHSRAQFMGTPSSDILNLIPGSSVEVIERCSGHDGTWGIKKKYHEMSLQIGSRLFKAIDEFEPDVTVTDCPLASLQIHHATKRKPVHTVQVLKEAYGGA